MFQENKIRQIFRKTNIFYPLKCAYQGVRNVYFSENLTCFVFLKHRFDIRLFALLPTIYVMSHISWVNNSTFWKGWNEYPLILKILPETALNSFKPVIPFWAPLKTLENLRISDVLRGYIEREHWSEVWIVLKIYFLFKLQTKCSFIKTFFSHAYIFKLGDCLFKCQECRT